MFCFCSFFFFWRSLGKCRGGGSWFYLSEGTPHEVYGPWVRWDKGPGLAKLVASRRVATRRVVILLPTTHYLFMKYIGENITTYKNIEHNNEIVGPGRAYGPMGPWARPWAQAPPPPPMISLLCFIFLYAVIFSSRYFPTYLLGSS